MADPIVGHRDDARVAELEAQLEEEIRVMRLLVHLRHFALSSRHDPGRHHRARANTHPRDHILPGYPADLWPVPRQRNRGPR